MMNTLNTNIYNYDNNIDKTHQKNTTELINWISCLKQVKIEIKCFIKLLEETLKGSVEDTTMLEKFKKKDFENARLLSVLNNYAALRENIVECDDTHCDMVYISEHESYRRTYLYHLEKYKNLKKIFTEKQKSKIL